jgi:hypothetical protein
MGFKKMGRYSAKTIHCIYRSKNERFPIPRGETDIAGTPVVSNPGYDN